ncbi:ankyrin repeat-containing protein [Xylariaceae sp. AK1471]|nr:ankyrin repeat-containing protein [Xylariaceae sp. AK1471]
MRLLNTTTLEIREFRYGEIPKYAILSHTWDEEEVTFQDMKGVTFQDIEDDYEENKNGYKKIKNCCSMARTNELSEAINSMFRWYEEADICYAYLADVLQSTVVDNEFRRSKWFTRGWTLQELIAPSTVIFLNSEWQEIGNRSDLQLLISEITRIPSNFLLGTDLGYASVAQRMSWAAKRKTTRIEDVAYCLMGLFDIYMPMLYGEGERAFIRLQEEILRVTNDHSIFAWKSTDDHGGILATSPAAFAVSGNIIQTSFSDMTSGPPTPTSRGIRLSLRFRYNEKQDSGLAILDCTEIGKENNQFAIHLRDEFSTKQEFIREQSSTLELLDMGDTDLSQYPLTDLYVKQWRSTRSQKRGNIGLWAVRLNGVGKDEIAFRTVYLDPNWELHDGLLITTTVLSVDGILGRVLVTCTDGNSFQLVLKKRERHLRTDIYNIFEVDPEAFQWSPIVFELQQHERDRTVNVLSKGLQVHVAIEKRVIVLHNEQHLVGVVEINYPPTRGVWLQHIAVLEGNIKEKTLLSYAAGQGYEAVVRLLLETGANPEAEGNDFRTPLSWATGNGHEAVVKLLLEKGANLEARDRYKRTPLSQAAENGHEALVKLLLEKGADLEAKDKRCKTLLSRIVELSRVDRNGHEAMIKLLLEKGADPEAENEEGQTSLIQAADKGHEAVVKLLFEKGANLEARDRYNRTPLICAAENGHEAVVKLLLEKDADPEAKDDNNITLLANVAQIGHEAVAKLLLEKGANVNARDRHNRTPLIRAAMNNQEAMIKLLLEKGADPEARVDNNSTLLIQAAEGGHEAVVKLLLEKGANLEARDGTDKTPLIWAAEKGHEAVVKLLLEKGADAEAEDKNRHTPLSGAIFRQHKAIVELLKLKE